MSPRTHFDRRGNGTKKGGRPKLPPGEKRDCPVKVNFDRKNYAKLLFQSKRIGKSLSEVIYELAVNGHVKEPVPQDTMKCLRALAGMANNLNQLEHLGHIHGPHYIADENRRLMAEISGLIIKLNELL